MARMELEYSVMGSEAVPHASACLSAQATASGLVSLHLTAGLGSGQIVVVRPEFVAQAVKLLQSVLAGQTLLGEVGPFTGGLARAHVVGNGEPLIGG
jgi:hypothetical protein